MLRTVICLAVFLSALGSTFAQDATQAKIETRLTDSYVIQLTEYRFADPLSPEVSASDILEMLTAKDNDAKAEVVETIRLSTLSGAEFMAQFGKRVYMTVGESTTGRGQTVRNQQAVDVGTIVRGTLFPRSDRFMVTLEVESSRLSPEGDDDSPQSTMTMQIRTSQLMDLGKPSLVGSSTKSTTSVIVALIYAK